MAASAELRNPCSVSMTALLSTKLDQPLRRYDEGTIFEQVPSAVAAQFTRPVISCRSKGYLSDGSIGVKRDLTLREGAYIAKNIQTWLAPQHADVSLSHVAAYFSSVEGAANVR
jgi:hypothetical protein